MKITLIILSSLFLWSCRNSSETSNNLNEGHVVQANNMNSIDTIIAIDNKIIKTKGSKNLGKKYQEMVDAGILNKEEAFSYSEIESTFRIKRIELQNTGKWDGNNPENIITRKEWFNNKKAKIIDLIGDSKYEQVQVYLKSIK